MEIAHSTLIADRKQGGLRLLDMETRIKACRVKTVIKFLMRKTDHIWMQYMLKYLYEVSGCGVARLLMCYGKQLRLLEKIPMFYREMLVAWSSLRKHLICDIASWTAIANQPLFLNPEITFEGDMLFNDVLRRTGINKITDIIYEFIPGFLSDEAIIEQVQLSEPEVSTSKIRCLRKLRESIPLQWKTVLLTGSRKKEDQWEPAFWIMKGEEKVEPRFERCI